MWPSCHSFVVCITKKPPKLTHNSASFIPSDAILFPYGSAKRPSLGSLRGGFVAPFQYQMLLPPGDVPGAQLLGLHIQVLELLIELV